MSEVSYRDGLNLGLLIQKPNFIDFVKENHIKRTFCWKYEGGVWELQQQQKGRDKKERFQAESSMLEFPD